MMLRMTPVLILFCLAPAVGLAVEARDPCHSPATLFAWCGRPEPLTELGSIVTDRPDFTEASSTVGWGVVQVETGYTYFRDDEAGVATDLHSWGAPLLRIGFFANWLEFRIAAFPITETVDGPAGRRTRSGTEDLYLGLKIGLTPQEGWLPEMAIMPQMTVPTGDAPFSDDIVLPGLALQYSWELSDDVSLGGSTQFNRAVDDSGDRYTEWAQSLALGRSLTDQVGIYGEWYAFFPHNAVDAGSEHYLDGGFTWTPNENMQFDLFSGFGLNEAAADFFIGAGVSVRYP